MAKIRLEGLTKRFGSVVAVNALDLEIQQGELVAFLGPSGCGKTTTLRMVAGFEQPTAGTIFFNDKDITQLPPESRNTGMVFQNYALFPHMTVYGNVAFGLEMRKVAKEEIRTRVANILAKVQLSGLEERYPRQLSGGQQQRTALARVLVLNPAVLLLDEPLANLDAKLREEMRFYIRTLQQEFGITTIYVTHDQSEALVMADRIAVMHNGVLQQLDEPEAIYRRPSSAWVADFIGLSNLVPGHVRHREHDRIVVDTPAGALVCLNSKGQVGQHHEEVLVCVRPESIHIYDGTAPLSNPGDGDQNRFSAVVHQRAYLGNLVDYRVRVTDKVTLRVQASPVRTYAEGEDVQLSFAAAEAWPIPKEGG